MNQDPSSLRKASITARVWASLHKTSLSASDARARHSKPAPQTWRESWKKLRCVISPSSRARLQWDFNMFLTVSVWVCIILPYAICFGIPLTLKTPMGVVDLCVSALFFADILLNFRTGYITSDGRVVTDDWPVALRYMRTWFIIDILAAMPWGAITVDGARALQGVLSSSSRILRLLRLLKFFQAVKFVRLLNLPGNYEQIKDILGSRSYRIGRPAAAGMLLIHLIGCFFHYIGSLEEGNSWLVHYGLSDAHNFDRYVASLYWATSTVVTVGYGDIAPITTNERIYGIFSMAMGASMFAYFIGMINRLVAESNAASSRVASQMQLVGDFLASKHIPHQLAKRVRRYYWRVLEYQMHDEELAILSGLSSELRKEVVLHMHRRMLEAVPFFRGKDPQFITAIIMRLKYETYLPGDCIVSEGEQGTDMYFLAEGVAEVRKSKLRSSGSLDIMEGETEQGHSRRSSILAKKAPAPYVIFRTLENGDYFGEYACLAGTTRSTSVVAVKPCEAYSLSRQALIDVLQDWPQLEEDLEVLSMPTDREGLAGSDDDESSSEDYADAESGKGGGRTSSDGQRIDHVKGGRASGLPHHVTLAGFRSPREGALDWQKSTAEDHDHSSVEPEGTHGKLEHASPLARSFINSPDDPATMLFKQLSGANNAEAFRRDSPGSRGIMHVDDQREYSNTEARKLQATSRTPHSSTSPNKVRFDGKDLKRSPGIRPTLGSGHSPQHSPNVPGRMPMARSFSSATHVSPLTLNHMADKAEAGVSDHMYFHRSH